jgi:hypothetical protein
MKNPFDRRPAAQPDPLEPPGAADADVLSSIRRLTADDERPAREDRGYGDTIFSRPPVDLPRFLTGRRRSRRH